jgi:hypothetical protein
MSKTQVSQLVATIRQASGMSAVLTIASEILQRRTSPVFPPAPGWGPRQGGIGQHANSNTDLRLSAREICELA